MLILIAGVSGNLGRYLAEAGLQEGHQIRGFGRSPSKLPPKLLKKLESFVQCEYYDDRLALDRAVSGVDSVICCYGSHAEAILDAQLSLLRAVERAGINIYHAHSWNFDWRKVKFGDFEHYDAYLSFRQQVELTSNIKPVYAFTGILGELALNEKAGIAHWKEDEGKKVLAHWGSGDARWDFTYLADAARFSIDLITTNKAVLAGSGGFFSFHSGEASAKDVAKAYENKTGEEVNLKSLGGVTELESNLAHARETIDRKRYYSFGGYYIQAAVIEKKWKLVNPVKVGSPDAVERLFDSQIETPPDYV